MNTNRFGVRHLTALSFMMVVVVLTVLTTPLNANADFIRSGEISAEETSKAEISEIRDQLETERLKEKLGEVGLSSHEIMERIDAMTPGERQAVIQDIETIQAGGERVSMSVITLLLILILVAVIA